MSRDRSSSRPGSEVAPTSSGRWSADLGSGISRNEEGLRVVQVLPPGRDPGQRLFGVAGYPIASVSHRHGTERWIGGGVEMAIDKGRLEIGDCWYGNADLSPETRSPGHCDLSGCVRPPLHVDRPHTRSGKDVFIAESRAEAERAGDALVAGGYRGFDRAAVVYGDPTGSRRAALGLRGSGVHRHHRPHRGTVPAEWVPTVRPARSNWRGGAHPVG